MIYEVQSKNFNPEDIGIKWSALPETTVPQSYISGQQESFLKQDSESKCAHTYTLKIKRTHSEALTSH